MFSIILDTKQNFSNDFNRLMYFVKVLELLIWYRKVSTEGNKNLYFAPRGLYSKVPYKNVKISKTIWYSC